MCTRVLRGPGLGPRAGPARSPWAGPGHASMIFCGPGAGLKLAGPGRARARNFLSTLVPGSGSFQLSGLAGLGYRLGLGFWVVFTIIVSLTLTLTLITTLTVILP